MAREDELTLFIWPAGLYPRRATFYLRAKQLPPSANIKIVACNMDFSTGKWESDEPKPPGSLPSLRIGKDTYVRQGSAILEYLEDILEGGRDMRGRNPEQRGRTRDMVNIINEAIVCFGFFIKNASEWTKAWSGLQTLQPDTARDALKDMNKRLGVLEGWITDDVVNKGLWLNGSSEGPSIADCTLISFVEYIKEAYSFNVLDDHPALQLWHQRYRDHPSFNGDPPLPDEMRQQASVLKY